MAVMITDADAYLGEVPAFGDEDEEYLSDTSSNLTEIRSQEFPSFFVEHDHRLFPSHGDQSYPFPVDGHEQNVRFFRLKPCLPFHACYGFPH